MTHRERPDRRPITGKVASLGLAASLAHRPGKTDRANRLIDRSPRRPGNAGNRQRPVSPAVHQGSLRHGPGRRLRYRALARQGCFRNTQHVDFCSIGIGHEATIEPGRTAGNRCQRLRYPPVQDSAVASISPRSISRRPTCSASFSSSEIMVHPNMHAISQAPAKSRHRPTLQNSQWQQSVTQGYERTTDSAQGEI